MSHLTYAEAIITGIVQGVSELFPVSSLGHNVLLPALLGGQWAKDLNVTAKGSPYLAFVVGLHVATAFAMIAYFWRDWVRIIRGFFTSIRDRQVADPDQRLAWMIILATIPVGLVGLLLQKLVTGVFAKPTLTALFLAVNGGVLLYSERQRRLRAAGPDGSLPPDGAWDDDGRDDRDWDDGHWADDRPPARGRRRADPRMGGDPRLDGDPWMDGDPRMAGDPRRGGDPRFSEDPRRGGRHAGGPPPGDGRQGQGGYAPGRPDGYPGGYQPGPGRGGYDDPAGYDDPDGQERTQVWNQQPGQQQWQGPDPRYDDPRYPRDDDPRYGGDPRYGDASRYGDDPRYGQDPGPRDPRYAPQPPAAGQPPAGQGPSFTPSFTPREPGPRQPDPRQADPRQPDPRQPDPWQADPRPGAGAAPMPGAVPQGPVFTPAGPGQGPGPGQAPRSVPDERGSRRAPWEDDRDFGGRPDRYGQDRYRPDRYEGDENGERVAADRRLATMTFKRAVLVGAWQIAALLPGISRDGIVTVGGMRSGLRREDAVRFSFLLSAPIILAAGVLKMSDLTGPAGKGIMGPVILGSLLSFVGAYFSVRFLTRYFSESKSLKPFGIYCLAFGLLSFLFLIAVR